MFVLLVVSIPDDAVQVFLTPPFLSESFDVDVQSTPWLDGFDVYRPAGMGACKSCDSCTNKGAVERQLQLLRSISGNGRGGGRFKVHLGKRIWVEGGDDEDSDANGVDPDAISDFMRPRIAPKTMGFTLASALAKRRKMSNTADGGNADDGDGDGDGDGHSDEQEDVIRAPSNTRLIDADNTPARTRARLDWRVRERILKLISNIWETIRGKAADQFDQVKRDVPAELEHRLFTQSQTPSDYKKRAKAVMFAMKNKAKPFLVVDFLAPLAPAPAPAFVLDPPAPSKAASSPAVVVAPGATTLNDARGVEKADPIEMNAVAPAGEELDADARSVQSIKADPEVAGTDAADGAIRAPLALTAQSPATSQAILVPESPFAAAASPASLPTAALPSKSPSSASKPAIGRHGTSAPASASSPQQQQQPQQPDGGGSSNALSKEEASRYVRKALHPFYTSGDLTKEKFKSAARSITHKLVGKNKNEAMKLVDGLASKFRSKFKK